MTARLLVANSFPIHPPRGGGQRRMHGLYQALGARGFEVEVVCLVGHDQPGRRVELAPGLVEVDVPKTAEHMEAEFALERDVGVVVTDVALPLLHELTPAYGEAIAAAAARTDIAVACHPYGYPALRRHCDQPLIYESLNVEADLKTPLLGDSDDGRRLLAEVERVEGECARDAALVTACSTDDAERLRKRYDFAAPAIVVSNGVDVDGIPYTSPAVRASLQAALGLDRPPVLFVGSWHGPNLEALDDVLVAAADAPDLRFLVLGSVSATLERRRVPPNVDVCGTVDDGFLRSTLAVAHVALNPMRSGSGTNLKMLDYAASGVPIVSTVFGARGLDMIPGRHYLAADRDTLATVLSELDGTLLPDLAAAARSHVAEHFGWRSIAARLAAAAPFQELVDRVGVVG